MKLQILVPRYNEPEDIIKGLLDSIKIQQGINITDLEVLIGDDGSETPLQEAFLLNYPYSIRYIQYDHAGVSGTRQRLFDEASADYIMYCDADDMFLTALALYTIFAAVRNGIDVLIADFVEELKDSKSEVPQYFTHNRDNKYVHGKVYRRRHLVDNKITWQQDISCHEDSAYNILAIETAKTVECCKLPIYIWRWRDDSICRSDKQYVLKTYPQMLKSNARLVKDLLERRMLDRAKFHIGSCIYSTYYTLNKPIWVDPMHAKYRYEAEKSFQQYYRGHKELFERIGPDMRNQLISGIKRRMMGEGVMMEQFTFDEWIDHIEELD